MLAGGFLAGQMILDLRLVYLVVIFSAVTGDCCGYVIGRTGGQRVLTWLATTFPFMRARYERLQLFFQTHGSKAVFMARFITGVRFMAGRWRVRAGCRFPVLGWNVLGAIVVVLDGGDRRLPGGRRVVSALAMAHQFRDGLASPVLCCCY